MIKNKPNRNYFKPKPSKRSIRRGDVVSTNGVGSIYSFKDHFSRSGNQDSLMLAGLSFWQKRMNKGIIPEELQIEEPRLKNILDKDFFVLPPDFRENSENKELERKRLPYFRFPQWHYCSHQFCGLMKKLGPTSEGNQKCKKNHKNAKSLIPVRFLIICKNGHIDDFPFFEWVHKKNKFEKKENKNKNGDLCDDTHLTYQAGKGGNNSVFSIRINCTNCGNSESLAEAFRKDGKDPFAGIFDGRPSCAGRRPWLGTDDIKNEICNSKSEVVLKNAIKVYYPVIKSSIYIPIDTKSNRKIHEFVNNVYVWNKIKKRINDKAQLKNWLDGYLDVPKYEDLKLEEVYKAIIEKEQSENKLILETKKDDEEAYRFQEYQFIKNPQTIESPYLELSIKKKLIEEYGILKKYFSNIFLVDRLTETRVQIGFTRSKPYEEGGDKNLVQKLSDDNTIRWLPGTIVKGEGIFFEFNKKTIDEWEKHFNFEHIHKIVERFNELRKIRGLDEIKNIKNKFFLIHTFSHLIINQLSFSCGYGNSSLRERIYCNSNSNENSMEGVLIYTASGDSEGSLGGLVREGEPKNLIKILKKMLRKAKVCSYDPVCIDHKQQGLNGTNASACHACCHLPETSCEESNQLLDRTTIIGNFKNNTSGYFKDLDDE